ncbi:MAG: hypothetical protein KBH94_05415 [Caldisericia bacterium]|nr:hypothetical protein [Caldisericia bacterium]
MERNVISPPKGLNRPEPLYLNTVEYRALSDIEGLAPYRVVYTSSYKTDKNGKYRTIEKSYIFNVLNSLSTGKYESMGVQGLEP